MEEGQRQKPKKRRKLFWICIFVVVILVVVGIVLWVTLRKKSEAEEFKAVFTSRCKAYIEGYDCEKTWSAFQHAYVGKDPCLVPPDAYQLLVDAAPFEPACNRMMFWSKTKDVVHDLTSKRDCFITMEDTFLGTVLNELTWCSKEGSSDTFTSGCPGWTDCVNNTVSSFWSKASESYAQVACGSVSVMLNGSIAVPFNPTSIFASIEVKNFNPAIMKSLKVVLVTQEKEVSDCANPSLKNLQKELAQGIAYSCQEVPESQIQECALQPHKPCGSCW
ncbi:ADP-ribosyl cyclase/cyclic ADP-ribose hydrolase 1-like [Periophthalmus magnuspinnatus]|uniref:ADP-ribosyl cyclase/cyclic ADP-ribose hydrolase 1-like n=1 Tax=Periophthalmus magnuspinnatus TaxID=409849 RepID=UPI00145BD862|nr:ADP-ribosyl cyclase/cyclic ADP-ribose hydrolase 1-like [Periophthalmus magnuspinnatus]